MNGEFISIETAEKIAKLEKENKKIKKGLKKAINKVCEQDMVIAQAIECINNYAVENDDYSKLYNDEEKELLRILKGDKNEIR
jgi:hypothetical protein